MMFPKYVHITEVGPRDGLQNEPTFVSTEKKIDFINQLSITGLHAIEVSSFVSPKSIPQLVDSHDVYQKINKNTSVTYSALVPNELGMQHALEVGVKKIAVFTAASETFTQKNIHCSIEESLERFQDVLTLAKRDNIRVRGYVSCAFGCPYEGATQPEVVAHLAEQLMHLGCDEIGIGDTIGIGTPERTKHLIHVLTKKVPLEKISMHFHDTYGQAIANIYASLQVGISSFDSSVSGLGGCPYAKGATGNVATEDVLYLLQELNIETGIDLSKVLAAGHFISSALNRKNGSKVAQALLQRET